MSELPALGRRVVSEVTGTAFLVAAVVGSGIAASRLSPHDTGLELLENSLATGAALVALILVLQPVSAHLNPVITMVEVAEGRTALLDAAALVAAQVGGAILGCAVANVMFDLEPTALSTTDRADGGHFVAELVATLGLVLVVLGLHHAGRGHLTAYAVGGWITAAYWFTSSTSFANPGVTIGRTLTDTFAGISPRSASMFVVMQVVGALLGLLLVRVLHPVPTREKVPA